MKLRSRSAVSIARASILAASLLAAGQVGAQTLTFDTAADCGSAGVLSVSGTCSTAGFTFTELFTTGGVAPTFQGYAITATGGATFSMSGFDGRNGLPAVDGPTGIVVGQPAPPGATGGQVTTFTQGISVVGTRADGTTVNFAYNNFGPSQTFTLGPSFSDLMQVQVTSSPIIVDANTFNVSPAGLWVYSGGFIQTRGFSSIPIDNLQVASAPVGAVPEPSTVALFGVSLAGLGLVSFRRRGRAITQPSA